MNNYIEVDVNKYVRMGIENQTLIPRKAQKIASVIAEEGVAGQTVISWSVDALGNAVEEKCAQVEIDNQSKKPGWVLTKVDEQGNIIIDNNGHPNQWIIDDTTFKEKYQIDEKNSNLYHPKTEIQTFVQINDNIIINQWGLKMKIANGGYINITNPNDMYGISQRDFEDTYRFIDQERSKRIR